jgi:hypothetical protein
MNGPESARSPRSRRRHLIAVPLLWAGLAPFTIVEPVAAASAPVPTATRTADGPPSAATVPSTKGLGLLTAAPATVHGVASDGSELNATFHLRRFQERRGVLYAVGRLAGALGVTPVNQTVQLPVTGASNPAPEAQGLRQPVPTPGACDLLTLSLGPLDLDLLGLRVALDEVNLLLEAIPGAGNLLGNLLCGVAGLLDGFPAGGLGGLLANLLDAIADLLNGLLGR